MVRTLRGSKQPSRPAGPIRARLEGGYLVAFGPAAWLPFKEAAMAALLQSAVTPSEGYAIVTLRGEVDVDAAEQLWQYLSYRIG
jgi:hypothetical protein